MLWNDKGLFEWLWIINRNEIKDEHVPGDIEKGKEKETFDPRRKEKEEEEVNTMMTDVCCCPSATTLIGLVVNKWSIDAHVEEWRLLYNPIRTGDWSSLFDNLIRAFEGADSLTADVVAIILEDESENESEQQVGRLAMVTDFIINGDL